MHFPVPAKILVIDDHPHIVEVLKRRLEAAGLQVISASDGIDGLQLAREQKPDLIILDIMLPKMNGYKLCRLLKYDARFKDIPIFMLTSRGKKMDEQTGRSTGADEYFVKPYDSQHLLAKIAEYLKNKQAGLPLRMFAKY